MRRITLLLAFVFLLVAVTPSAAQSGLIAGTVRDFVTGTPLAGVPVSALSFSVEVATASTDASGRYTILGLAPGAYGVRTMLAPGTYINEWHDGLCVGCEGVPATVVVGAGASVEGIDFSLAVGGAISGRITCNIDFLAEPPVIDVFSSAGVLLRRHKIVPGPFRYCTTAGQDYLVADLPVGQYFLLARDSPCFKVQITTSSTWCNSGTLVDILYGDVVCQAADCDVRRGMPVSVTAGNTTAGIDFNMRIGVSSEWVSSARALTIFDARGVELVGMVRVDSTQSPFHPPPNRQQIVGVVPGTYFLTWGGQLHDGIVCQDCPPTSGTPIVLHPGHYLPIPSFGNEPVRRIGGTVTDAVSGAPIDSITVEVIAGAGREIAHAFTDVSGHYSVGPLAPGTYYVRTSTNRGLVTNRRYVDEVYDNHLCAACDPRTGTPVVVGAVSDVAGIDFALALGGVVSGTVLDVAGRPLHGTPMSLFSAGGALMGRSTSFLGTYGITLPAGTYRARTEASPAHAAEIFSEQPCTSAACDVTAGTPIAVTTGTTTSNINFTLASCSAMTLSPPLLASGVIGRSYRQVVSVSGGVGPYAFSVSGGLLPLGTTLAASTGVLEGTPTVSGRHTFTVGAVDASGCATARAYTLDVQACAFALSPASATVPAAGGAVTITIADACGSQTVTGLAFFVTVQSNVTGQVVLDVSANAAAAPRTNILTIGRRVFTVRQAGVTSQPPFGVLDAPLDGAQVSGSIAVGGWALDDLEVRRVQIFRDPVGGEPPMQMFIGTAVFVAGARPDVQQVYPTYPLNNRAGWGFLILTNMLPNQGNGAFRIYAYAEDAEGSRTLLGARTIVASNANATLPFGAIDTPGQGETIAGSGYLNWGWALTPQPKMIPTDGTTIQVYVDGVPQGSPVYNLFRSDVSGLFPGLANSGGPVGYRVLDTTALAEGQHTIAWVVADSQGAANGIGSRYFSVANSADAQVQGVSAAAAASNPPDAPVAESGAPAPAVAVLAGPDHGRRAASLTVAPATDRAVAAQRGDEPARRLQANDEGKRTVTLRALERLELTLSDTVASCAGTWAGYLVDGDRLNELPVGAAIDPAGTFYWQPGPGFKGTFELLFVRTACDGSKERLPVTVTIAARH